MYVRHHQSAQLRWSDPDLLGHVDHARAQSPLDDQRAFWMAYQEDES